MPEHTTVCLNLYPVHILSEHKRTVYRYSYSLTEIAEDADIYGVVGKILYNIGDATGVQFNSEIITTQPIATEHLQNKGWQLQENGTQQLDPSSSTERKALEQLCRRQLRYALRHVNGLKVENTGAGLVLWDDRKVEKSGAGWQVLRGALIDIVVDSQGLLSLEIDTHYRFYSPWTVHQWLERYPGAPLTYVRNVGTEYTWHFLETSEERPETIQIQGLGQTLEEYHLGKGVSQRTIQESTVVYVQHTKKRNSNRKPVAHLSKLLQPSVSMEVLSYVAEQGDQDAADILKRLKTPISERLTRGIATAKWLIEKIYDIRCEGELQPQRKDATQFKQQPLFTRNQIKINRPKDVIQKGCLGIGEVKFGCLHLQDTKGGWPETVKQQLLSATCASATAIDLGYIRHANEIPNRDMARRRFWSDIAQQGIQTILVVSKILGNERKTQLRREALQAGIALQFMRPMPKPDEFRAANITLGLLVKAGWQPIGIKMSDHAKAAELTIGFDAGTNKKLFYGTSAFAVLGDGQSLGWEIPEAQAGEKFSDTAIWHATLNILERFHDLNERNPRRILLLRDGFVRDREFDLTLTNLEKEGIAVDLLEVHKSGAGRMARLVNEVNFLEVLPGTGFSIGDDAFRIVTSKAHAGGSARPLEVVKLHGDASLRLLADEIFSLSQFHPASAFSSSRLPMPLHYADKMIKEVQRMGQLSVLHGVNRQKIFAA